MDFPNGLIGIPESSGDGVLQFDVFGEAVLVHHVLEISPNLRRLGIVLGPVGVSLPCELVGSRRDVTGASGIP